ncbi:matrix metalloproteinase-17b [Megalops cyprinoides]|uniref:matrix metalloproteinase-17b n=1 Tax=Megalops cyprinoides TaxID=118141 RepID=UPI0018655445|nr:matrix metalloproteinase-17b [Megalops cyprinoides]
MKVPLWISLLLCVYNCTGAVPAAMVTLTSQTASSSAPVSPTEDVSAELVDWLTQYGYLPPADLSTGQLQAWTAVTQAVKAMQKFAGLKDTGVVDEDTLNLMRTPRCSLPDEDVKHTHSLDSQMPLHRQKRGTSTWTHRNINWRLRSYPVSSVLSREMIRSLVFYALRVWAEPTQLEFHEVGSPGAADLQVDFLHGSHGDGYPFDGLGGAVGHAFFPSDPKRAGGVHLDSEEDWAFRQPASEGTDLFTVLVHEFGHALGLSHSSARRSVMRPYYQGPAGDPLHFTLGPPDREQITRLNTVDRCSTTFDAVAKIRGETFFFKGPYMWRVSSGALVSGKAASTRRLWSGLPPNFTPLRAVLERHSDHGIVFITGSQYWLFKDLSLQQGYPRPLSDLVAGGERAEQGLVWDTDKGAVWGERETVRVAGAGTSEAWRELLSAGVNGITTERDGSVYIFRGLSYWKFPAPGSEPEEGYPRSLATDWLDCPHPSPSLPAV